MYEQQTGAPKHAWGVATIQVGVREQSEAARRHVRWCYVAAESVGGLCYAMRCERLTPRSWGRLIRRRRALYGVLETSHIWGLFVLPRLIDALSSAAIGAASPSGPGSSVAALSAHTA